MLIGYARVSTPQQVLDHQADALRRAGVAVERIYADVASGKSADRPGFAQADAALRMGDVLVVTRLDRIGRSLSHLVVYGERLRERGVGLVVTEQGIDTSTTEGRMMFGMIATFAEFQRDLIAANTRDGLAAARARGRVGGRPRRLNDRQIKIARALYDKREMTVRQIAETFQVPRSTLHGYLTDPRLDTTA